MVEACFVLELSTECSAVEPEEGVRFPEVFSALRVEGERYGPATWKPSELPQDGRLVVPRKAEVLLAAGSGVNLSLYPVTDADFRRPAFRRAFRPNEPLFVPAGRFVVSLSAEDGAPDLQRFDPAPGGRYNLTFHRRAGWSAVLRVSTVVEGQPVAGATVRFVPSAGFGRSPGAERTVTTDDVGLALWSGISEPLATGHVEHRDFAKFDVAGLAAAPGSFDFREVALPRAAELEVRVLEAEQTRENQLVRLVDYSRNPAGEVAEPAEITRGRTGRDGRLRFRGLTPGAFTVRLEPPAGGHLETVVELLAGERSDVTFELQPFVVSGAIRRGDRPAPGYAVQISDAGQASTFGAIREPVANATADAEGQYSARLWRSGQYVLVLFDPQGQPVGDIRRVALAGDEAIDFLLSGARVLGQVVDEKGEGVVGARLSVTWERTDPLAALSFGGGRGGRIVRAHQTGKDGFFSLDFEEGSGQATVTASREGYAPSKRVELTIDEVREPPPLQLVLRRESAVHGRLLSARGTPVSEGWVAGVDAAGVVRAQTRTDGEGRFELPLSAGTLFASGPECALLLQPLGPSAAEFETLLHCPPGAGALFLELRGNVEGGFLVRQNGFLIPPQVLSTHLGFLGLSGNPGPNGRVAFLGLSPGTYEVYLARAANRETISAGLTTGLVTAAQLSPGQAVELTVEVVP